jgi:glucosamine--fructose-6-phosphate aminotransferase (isomerizing)
MFVGSDAHRARADDRQDHLSRRGRPPVVTRDLGGDLRPQGQPASNRATRRFRSAAQVDKGGYKHFMAKEIYEQPTVLADALGAYLGTDDSIHLPEPGLDFTQFDRVIMVACGTAYYACHRRQILVRAARRAAGGGRYRLGVPLPRAANRTAHPRHLRQPVGRDRRHARRAPLSQGRGRGRGRGGERDPSSIARESDLVLPIMAGVEIGVASTKAFTCQLTVLAALALKAGRDRGELDDEALGTALAALRAVPGAISQALTLTEAVGGDISAELSEASDVLYLGRGAMYPLALEGALKLKEISYIHAEGYASGELKHGPIALVDPHTPVIVFAPHDKLFEKTVSNMQEVLARGGKVLLVTDRYGIEKAGDTVWKTIRMPEVDPLVAPIIYSIPAQLIAYGIAVARGTDVDQPRNLAKSVTVE